MIRYILLAYLLMMVLAAILGFVTKAIDSLDSKK